MANKVTTLIDTNTNDQLYPRTKVEAISDANSNSLQYLLDSKQDDLTAGAGITINGTTISSKLNMDLLWTNSAPSSNFAEQTITSVDLTGYTYIVVQYALSKSYNQYRYVYNVMVDGNNHTNFFPQYRNWNRGITATTSSIYFTNCVYYNSYGNTGTTTTNDYMIPLYIYGVR